ncbi:MAG: sulfatase [Cytophagales bacterium]|nr:sulfatase [Cytophagales bacterium]
MRSSIMKPRSKHLRIYTEIAVLFVACIALNSCSNPVKKTNIILFFIDDLGWTDLGCYGSDLYETPNIDKLASEGVRFTNAYSACTVCSPSRAALMTGKYPARLHLTDWIRGYKPPNPKLIIPDWQMYLDTAEVTIAKALKKGGYTTANFGKWHLGDEPIYWPENHGFDVNVGGYRWGAPGSYFYPYHGGKRDKRHPPGLENGKEREYLTDRLTDEALRFMEQQKEGPFFIYFPHYAVHTPIQAHDSITRYFKAKVTENHRHRNAAYAAMIRSVDHSLGRLRNKLKALGIEEHTAIFFTSDNGGLELWDITDNGKIRAGKGAAYEGGVRVPCIVLIPGITRGGAVSDAPIIGMDLFPTILDLAGLEVIENDGENILPLVRSPGQPISRSALFWHYPHYHRGGATPYSAIRMGDYKLIEFFEDGRLELYDLATDIGEEKDLRDTEPELLRKMHQKLQLWREEVNAQYPSENPDYKEMVND